MSSLLIWKLEYLEPVVALCACALGFIGYYFITSSKLLHTWFTAKFGEEKTLVWWVVFQKFAGVVFLGIIPAIIGLTILSKTPADFGMKTGNALITLYWIAGLAAVIIPMNLIFARKPDNIKTYPQIRTREWDMRLVLANTLSWMAYLLAYEYLFRGFLLFSCLPAEASAQAGESTLGAWPAIAINTAIYAFVHIPKGIKETLGAIPFGILLCIITLNTGTIWVAFFAHVILSQSGEYIALYFNPEMQFKFRKHN